MNPRDVIDEVILRTVQQGWQCDVQTDDILDALAAAGFVVVACPPGSRVVVSRESKPCARCEDGYLDDKQGTEREVRCPACGGSEVVEATTTHGLAETAHTYRDMQGNLVEGPPAPFTLFRLVALPEETP